jgi:hypothetical protein
MMAVSIANRPMTNSASSKCLRRSSCSRDGLVRRGKKIDRGLLLLMLMGDDAIGDADDNATTLPDMSATIASSSEDEDPSFL